MRVLEGEFDAAFMADDDRSAMASSSVLSMSSTWHHHRGRWRSRSISPRTSARRTTPDSHEALGAHQQNVGETDQDDVVFRVVLLGFGIVVPLADLHAC